MKCSVRWLLLIYWILLAGYFRINSSAERIFWHRTELLSEFPLGISINAGRVRLYYCYMSELETSEIYIRRVINKNYGYWFQRRRRNTYFEVANVPDPRSQYTAHGTMFKPAQTNFVCGNHAPSCYRNLLLSSACGSTKGVTSPKILLEPKFNTVEGVGR